MNSIMPEGSCATYKSYKEAVLWLFHLGPYHFFKEICVLVVQHGKLLVTTHGIVKLLDKGC